jgi:protein-disulfide isomerase
MMADPVPPVDDRDHVRGAQAPAVTIIEYGDYDCPHTRAAQSVVDRLAAENPDVRVVFRPFPLQRINPHAETLARIAEGADLQRRFWPVHDHLMNREGPVNERIAIAEVAKLGVDAARLASDIGGRIVIARVEKYVKGGLASGIHTTPAFFFNGTLHEGTYDYDILRERLEEWRQMSLRSPR